MFALLTLVTVLHLTAKDNNKSFTVKVHSAIVVTLASNRSTGYHWKRRPSPVRDIRLVSHRYVPPKTSRPGAAGKEVWRVKVVGPHDVNTALQLRYVAPSQPKKVARRFVVEIHVS